MREGVPVPDLDQAFADIRRSLTKTLLGLDPEAWATPVATRPEWSVKDTVAMLTGFAQSMVGGRWTEDYSDSWQDPDLRSRLHERFEDWIAGRRGLPMEAILLEWEHYSGRLERMMAREEPFPEGSHPFSAWTYLWAVVQNAHNIWSALGVPAKDRDSEATSLCLESAVYWLDMRLQAAGAPALRVRAGDREWVVGDGTPATTVTAEPFDLFRALSGRRSLDQIRAFCWEGDAEPFLAIFSPFEAPKEAVFE